MFDRPAKSPDAPRRPNCAAVRLGLAAAFLATAAARSAADEGPPKFDAAVRPASAIAPSAVSPRPGLNPSEAEAFRSVGVPPPIPPPATLAAPAVDAVFPAGAEAAAPVDSLLARVECSTCGTQYSPTLPSVGNCPSCGGSGMCSPGRKGCHPWHAHTGFGRFLGNLYECICCPDPCYQPGWVAEANAAFMPDFPRAKTLTRFRWDYGRNMVFPDRNEYFWPRSNVSASTWQSGNPASPAAGQLLGGKAITKVDPKTGQTVITHLSNGVSSYAGKGPKPGVVVLHGRNHKTFKYQPWGERQLTFNELFMYQEAASASGAASVFFEYPYRSWTGLYDGHAAGFGDLRFGSKAVLLDCELLLLTFQFKTYMPTGNFIKGLGTGHVSLEPSLIAALRLGPDTYLQGQIAEWIPLGGDTAYAGTMLNYHLAVNHVLHRFTPNVPLIGTFEGNGWSFQDGAYTNPYLGPTPSSHDSYFSFGPGLRLSVCDKVDFGTNVSFPLGGDHWASTWVRTELRVLY